MALVSAAVRFDNVPDGYYEAVLTEITEAKPYESTYQGKTTTKMKSRFVYEITRSLDGRHPEAVGEKLSRFVNMGGHGSNSGLWEELEGLALDPSLDYDTNDIQHRKIEVMVKIKQNAKKVWRSEITSVVPVRGQPVPPIMERAATARQEAVPEALKLDAEAVVNKKPF